MFNRFRDWKLEWQVLSSMLLSLLLVAVVSGMTIYRSEVLQGVGEAHEQNQAKSHLLHAAVKEVAVAEDSPAIQAMIDEIALHDGSIYRITVRNEHGALLAEHLSQERAGGDMRRYANSITHEGVYHGSIEVEYRLDEVYKDIRAHSLNSLTLLLVPLIVFALVMMLLARALVVRPLHRITQRLAGVSKGDFDRQLPALTSREMTYLGRAVNDLAAHMQSENEARQNLTNAKRAVDHLRRQNEMILNSAGDGIYGLDRQGRTTFVNQAAAKMLGWEVNELIGQSQHALIQHSHSDGQHYPVERCPIHATLRDGTVHNVSNEVFWRRDGSSIPVEYISTPILDGDVVTGAVIVFHDITERLLQEQELRFAASTFDGPAAIILTDTAGVILRVNPAYTAMSGYAGDEVIGRKVGFQKSGLHDAAFYAEMWRQLIARGRWEGELWNRSKAGETYPIWQTIKALKNSQGKTTHYISQSTDIRHLKRIEADLREAVERSETANQAKAGFLAMMSHEIRTPLSGVLGVLGLMQETPLDPQQRNYVRIARDSSEALLEIISDILDFSKIEAGKLDFEAAPLDLRYLVEGVGALLESRAADKGVALRFVVDEAVPVMLSGDPGRTRQVLLNLVSNAIKYTPEGSVMVHLSLVDRHDDLHRVRFEVVDTGIGIAESLHDELFSEFTTLDASYARKYGGTGLGLAICRRLVEMMGGEIDFTSQQGVGSRFWFELSLPLAEEEPSLMMTAHAAGDAPVQGARVLLAEDVAANREVVKSMLERCGHYVDVAANGLEAVEAVRNFPYDVVLMDISMPEMDGLQALLAIRKLPGQHGAVPIIAMTAHAMVGDREGFVAAGMDDYLSKPVNRAQLEQIVARWAGARSRNAVLAPPPLIGLSETGSAARLANPASEDGRTAVETPNADTSEPTGEVDVAVLEQLAQDTSPELVPELIGLFVEEARGRVARIAAALVVSDDAVVRHECHALGSSAATYGLPRMHQLARVAERALRDGDTAMAREYAAKLTAAADGAFAELLDAAGSAG